MPQEDSSHSRAVTSRVVQVMMEVIAKDPKIKNQKAFADAIKTHATMVSRWVGRSAPCTLEDAVIVCKRFRINPTWLILGLGNMFMAGGSKSDLSQLERQVSDLSIRVGEMEIRYNKNPEQLPGTDLKKVAKSGKR